MKLRVWPGYLAFLTVFVSCGGDPAGPTPDPITAPALLTLGSTSITDTIETKVTAPFVVTVADSNGKPVPNRVVEFVTLGASLAADGLGYIKGANNATTDSAGKARMYVRMDTVAGAFHLRATVGGTTLKDSIPLTVLPGNLISLSLAPRDSVVYVNNSYVVRTARLDRKNNHRSELPAYTARTAGVITMPESTVVRGDAFGRTTLVAELGAFKDSVIVSVVPTAVIVATANPGLGQLHVVNLDGSGHTVISANISTATTSALRFNQAGTSILYHDNDELYGQSRIFSINLDGTGKQQLSASTLGTLESQPQMSRDGAWIYYTRFTGDLTVWRATATFANPTRLTPAGQKEFTPTPSPDGTRLAFFAGQNAPQPILVRNLNTGVTDTTAAVGEALRWSPVGDEIAVVSGTELRIYHTATKTLSTIDVTGGHHFQYPHVDWSPDGAWILSCAKYGVVSPNPNQIVLIRRSPHTVIPLAWTRTWSLCQAAWKP
jgi:hypothetical protein